ncbi:hypothetical protein ACQ4LE_000111 [Meloidogyne hapla]
MLSFLLNLDKNIFHLILSIILHILGIFTGIFIWNVFPKKNLNQKRIVGQLPLLEKRKSSIKINIEEKLLKIGEDEEENEEERKYLIDRMRG